MHSSLPEHGQLVEVRRRQWVVSDIVASALPGTASKNPQHLVRLASIDEDSLGEALEAIWEIEPGARILERAALPAVERSLLALARLITGDEGKFPVPLRAEARPLLQRPWRQRRVHVRLSIPQGHRRTEAIASQASLRSPTATCSNSTSESRSS